MLGFCQRQKIDLVHIYLGTEAARLLPYLRREQRPKIISFHGADVSDALSDDSLKALIRHSDLFMTRSHSLRNALIQRGCDPERILLNPTGVPVPPECRQLSWSDREPTRILQACRFVAKKGIDVSLEAIAILARQGLPIEFTLVGDGPERASIEQQIQTEGIGQAVKLVDFLPNDQLLALMQQQHLFIHPSRETATGDREGIPNALLEAMALGNLVITTRHSGIPEVIEHGENGLLIEEAKAEPLAQAITEAINHRSSLQEMALRGYERVKSDFSIEACQKTLLDNYRHALALPRSSCTD
jgi:colanic acid/amylovoran biosynthesis glycosyltransferase